MRFFFLPVFILLGLTISFGQGSVQVIAEKANLRSSPSARAAVVATVAQDDALELIESRGAWYKVKTTGHVGWIHGNAVRKALSNPSFVLPPPGAYNDRYKVWGDPNSKYGSLSSGPGSGGGMGTGQGSGTGTGSGSGSVASSGQGSPAVEVPRVSGTATTPLRFLTKPRAIYTDVARTNNVQGTVKLKITFLASGQIGPIVPLTRLPDGLTEQAEKAARLIKFEPKRIKGVAQTVVATLEYNFSIY